MELGKGLGVREARFSGTLVLDLSVRGGSRGWSITREDGSLGSARSKAGPEQHILQCRVWRRVWYPLGASGQVRRHRLRRRFLGCELTCAPESPSAFAAARSSILQTPLPMGASGVCAASRLTTRRIPTLRGRGIRGLRRRLARQSSGTG